MGKLILLGDEAIAQGALDAGISGMYAYPGTPSTEILEYVQRTTPTDEVHSDWSANEKTAMEAALGMSYAGKRAMVCMKHVGLNVAADAFMNSAITGVNGGLVIAVADDPSMHSSQNEQDSRYYGKFALIPVLEPSSQQEAYDMAYHGFELSERFNVPVMLRLTTRLAHSRSAVSTLEKQAQKQLSIPDDPSQFILLPSLARKSYRKLLDNQEAFGAESVQSPYNRIMEGEDSSLGIIACGLAHNYLLENYPPSEIPHPVLKLCQYPVPVEMIRRIYETCRKILVLEEGYPLVEEQLRGILDEGKPVHGRLDGTIPRDGELNPDLVKNALARAGSVLHGEMTADQPMEIPDIVRNRPPALCKGCSHADVFHALNEVMNPHGAGKVFSDIGCYTLGALPPYNSIHTCVDMGASVTMAKGAADAGLRPSVCVIGDSTFTHSGMTGLLDAVMENSPITVIISDNSTTGMTGGQASHATGRLVDICTGIGVAPEHVRTLNPLRKYHGDNVNILREEVEYPGVSVILAQRECIQTATRRKKSEAGKKK
jgi:indolepyruvate ferredoxin oxidoreductase alpha subunit